MGYGARTGGGFSLWEAIAAAVAAAATTEQRWLFDIAGGAETTLAPARRPLCSLPLTPTRSTNATMHNQFPKSKAIV